MFFLRRQLLHTQSFAELHLGNQAGIAGRQPYIQSSLLLLRRPLFAMRLLEERKWKK